MDESTIYQNCNTVALNFASNNFSVALNFFFQNGAVIQDYILYQSPRYQSTSDKRTK